MDNKDNTILELDKVYLKFKPEFAPKIEIKEEEPKPDEPIYKTVEVSKEEIVERLLKTQSLHL